MSVLEATIFYTRSYTQDLKDEMLFGGKALSYSARRVVSFCAVSGICVLGIFYIYLVGSIVAGGFVKEELLVQLEELHSEVQNIERTALQGGRALTTEFCVSRGYHEPRSFDALTRSRNVAETSQKSRFY